MHHNSADEEADKSLQADLDVELAKLKEQGQAYSKAKVDLGGRHFICYAIAY